MFGEELVSVVIPYYSNQKWLLEALESVSNQTYQNYEIIIIDDGSPEPLLNESSSKENLRYIRGANKGAGAARNIGIEISKGKYIAFLDSDDLWQPEKLEKQISGMEKNDAIWSCESYTTFGNDEYVVDSSVMNGDVYLKVLTSSKIATPAVVIHGPTLRKNKHLRFSEEMKYGEDTYFWLHLAHKYPIYYSNTNNTRVRLHGDNAAKKVISQLFARSNIYCTLLSDPEYYRWNLLPNLLKYAYKLSFINYNKYKNKTRTVLKDIYYYTIPWLIYKYCSKYSTIPIDRSKYAGE